MSDPIRTPRAIAAPLRRWLRRSRGSIAPAVVLGGSTNGLSFARSLGRRGVPVLMLDTGAFPGLYTRHADVLDLPSIQKNPQEWLRLLEWIGQQLPQPTVLFSTGDAHNLLIARNSDRLERHFRFLLPDLSTVEQISNKRQQYDFAARIGVPIPAVHYPDSVEHLRSLVEQICFPCLLKPFESHSSKARLKQKVLVVASAEELLEAYQQLAASGLALMVQEIIPGPDSELYGYLAFWDRDGRERAWVTKRKLRQFPPGYGDGSLQTTLDAPEVADLSRRLLSAMNYRGFVGVEYKRDPRDQTMRLMEINARTVSGNQLAISAGVDFPWIGYQYLMGAPLDPNPITPSGPPVKYINEEWDIQAMVALRRTGELGVLDWLRSIRGARAKAIGAWDDPMPLLAGLGRAMTLLNPPSVPILTFHIIGNGAGPTFLPTRMFRRILASLHEHGCQTPRLVDLLRCIRLRLPLPEKSVILTFDDGDRSLYDLAWPLLREFGMTATVFLLANESRHFEHRELLSWSQARHMQQGGIDFGSHTLTHPDLTRLSDAQIESEMDGSKQKIADHLGCRVTSFAYPFGRHDHRCRQIARKHFDGACSDDLGLAEGWNDPSLLKRVDSYYLRSPQLSGLIFSPLLPWYLRLRNGPRLLKRMLRG